MFIVKLIPLKDLSEIKIARCFSRQDREVLEQRKEAEPRDCIYKVIKWSVENVSSYSINVT